MITVITVMTMMTVIWMTKVISMVIPNIRWSRVRLMEPRCSRGFQDAAPAADSDALKFSDALHQPTVIPAQCIQRKG